MLKMAVGLRHFEKTDGRWKSVKIAEDLCSSPRRLGRRKVRAVDVERRDLEMRWWRGDLDTRWWRRDVNRRWCKPALVFCFNHFQFQLTLFPRGQIPTQNPTLIPGQKAVLFREINQDALLFTQNLPYRLAFHWSSFDKHQIKHFAHCCHWRFIEFRFAGGKPLRSYRVIRLVDYWRP
jgi:hypothetical protein